MSVLPEGVGCVALGEGNYLEILVLIDHGNGFGHVGFKPALDRELQIVSSCGQQENATRISRRLARGRS
jgi:hypothetical protein